jgi:hypothetical protein
MKHMHTNALIAAFLIFALLTGGCTKDEPSHDESVKQGEARSVFVRNNSGIPMTFSVEINGLPFETIELEDNQTAIYYAPLPVGLPRKQIERYKIEGKLVDDFGRSTENHGIEFSLDVGESGVFPYHPTGWTNGTLHPSYRFTENLNEWLEEIDAVARKIENFRTIHVIASPDTKAQNNQGEPLASGQRC